MRYLESLGRLGNHCGNTAKHREVGRLPIHKFFRVNGLRHDCPSQYRGRPRYGGSVLAQIDKWSNTTGRRTVGRATVFSSNLRRETIPQVLQEGPAQIMAAALLAAGSCHSSVISFQFLP